MFFSGGKCLRLLKRGVGAGLCLSLTAVLLLLAGAICAAAAALGLLCLLSVSLFMPEDAERRFFSTARHAIHVWIKMFRACEAFLPTLLGNGGTVPQENGKSE